MAKRSKRDWGCRARDCRYLVGAKCRVVRAGFCQPLSLPGSGIAAARAEAHEQLLGRRLRGHELEGFSFIIQYL